MKGIIDYNHGESKNRKHKKSKTQKIKSEKIAPNFVVKKKLKMFLKIFFQIIYI
jgi:hypothetical protein